MLLSHFRPKVTEGAKCEMTLLKPRAKVNLPALRCSLLNYVTVIKILLTVFWDRKKKNQTPLQISRTLSSSGYKGREHLALLRPAALVSRLLPSQYVPFKCAAQKS